MYTQHTLSFFDPLSHYQLSDTIASYTPTTLPDSGLPLEIFSQHCVFRPLRNQEVITPRATLSSVAAIDYSPAILLSDYLCFSRAAQCHSLYGTPRAPNKRLSYPTPCARHPDGHLVGIFLYGRAFSYSTIYSSNGEKAYLYINICMATLSIVSPSEIC